MVNNRLVSLGHAAPHIYINMLGGDRSKWRDEGHEDDIYGLAHAMRYRCAGFAYLLEDISDSGAHIEPDDFEGIARLARDIDTLVTRRGRTALVQLPVITDHLMYSKRYLVSAPGLEPGTL